MSTINFLQVIRETREERIANCLEHDKETLIGWLTTRDKCIPYNKENDIRVYEIPPSEMIKTLDEYRAMSLQELAELIADRDLYESPITCKENEERHIVTDSWNDSNGEVHTTTREMIY